MKSYFITLGYFLIGATLTYLYIWKKRQKLHKGVPEQAKPFAKGYSLRVLFFLSISLFLYTYQTESPLLTPETPYGSAGTPFGLSGKYRIAITYKAPYDALVIDDEFTTTSDPYICFKRYHYTYKQYKFSEQNTPNTLLPLSDRQKEYFIEMLANDIRTIEDDVFCNNIGNNTIPTQIFTDFMTRGINLSRFSYAYSPDNSIVDHFYLLDLKNCTAFEVNIKDAQVSRTTFPTTTLTIESRLSGREITKIDSSFILKSKRILPVHFGLNPTLTLTIPADLPQYDSSGAYFKSSEANITITSSSNLIIATYPPSNNSSQLDGNNTN